MTTAELGALERVDVRKAWPHEAHNFTPWLAENLASLSAELGIELELEDTEVQVEEYRADIVARIPQDGALVLIENQLNMADLQHLGQVLAYLAGLEAQIVVWVATGFRDAHLSAIRWLNEHTVDPFAFFAVQVGVVRIGDSQLAPVFDVLERPNEWNRQVQKVGLSGDLSPDGRLQRDFWAHCAARWQSAPNLRPGYALPNFWHKRVKGTELRVVQYVSNKRVGAYLTGKHQGEAQVKVEARIKPYQKLVREALKGANFRKGKSNRCETELEIDTHDPSNWDQMADWLDDQRQKYENALRSGPGV